MVHFIIGLILGAIGGGFIARKNPILAAKTLADLEVAFNEQKAKLLKK